MSWAERIAALFFLLLIAWLGFFVEREQSAQVLLGFGALFLIYFFILNKGKESSLLLWAGAAIVARLLLVFAWPALSDDFYRFLWDGHLWLGGFNPFDQTPEQFAGTHQLGEVQKMLLERMNSPAYHTVYPPVCQAVFLLGALSDSIWWGMVTMKTVLFLAECGTIALTIPLLRTARLPRNLVLVYALNPLVILEGCGNLHFEVLMVFFLALALYFLQKNETLGSGISLGLAIATKLNPLIYLPAMLRGQKKWLMYTAIAGSTCLVLFALVISPDFLENILTSLNLYFQTFEFNASLYYLVRWLGYRLVGYNVIQWAGIGLSIIALVCIIAISLARKSASLSQLAVTLLLVGATHLFFATTVHPWYVVPLVFFSMLCRYRFALIWSAMAVLSYTAYRPDGVQEQLWAIGLEYLVVFGVLGWELWRDRQAPIAQ